MKALIGVDTLTDLAPSSVISEMERLVERVQGDGFHRSSENTMESAEVSTTAHQERGISHSEQFALTECEHGVHVNELCAKCDPESALEAQNQAEECSDMDVFHRY